MQRAWIAWVAVCVAPLLCADEELERRLRTAIVELGHSSFEVREAASATLAAAGQAAVPLLRQAAESTDHEVKARARQLLEELEWDAGSGVPRELVRRLRRGGEDARVAAARELIALGPDAYPVVAKAVLGELDPETQRSMADAWPGSAPCYRACVRHLIGTGQVDAAITLLERLAQPPTSATPFSRFTTDRMHRETLRDLAALHVHRGSLEPAIDRAHDPRSRYWLERAAGRPERVLAAARESGDERLVDAVLYERRDWEALLTRAPGPELASLARRAMYATLAGRLDLRGPLVDEIQRRCGDDVSLLALLGEAHRALAVADAPTRSRLLWECGFHAESLPGPYTDFYPVDRLDRLAELGLRDEALRGYEARVSAAELDDRDSILRDMAMAGFGDRARALLVAELERVPVDERADYIRAISPYRGDETRAWWRLTVRESPDTPIAERVARVASIMDGTADPDALIAALRRAAPARPFGELALLCATAASYDRHADVAELLGAGARSPDDWEAAGAAAVRAQRWALADTALARAAAERRGKPKVLALRALALARIGKHDESTVTLGLALRCSMADEMALFDVAQTMRGTELATGLLERLADLERLAPPDSPLTSRARDILSPAPRDLERDGYVTLWRLTDTMGDRLVSGNEAWHLSMASSAHVALGQLSQRAGQLDRARAHAEVAWTALPRNADAIALRAQVHADRSVVEAMLEAEHAHWQRQIELLPLSGYLHEQWAVFSARTRSRLDVGLRAARRAVELSPARGDGHAALAEVLLEQGDVVAAADAIAQAIALNPRTTRFEQLHARIREASSPR